MKNLISIAVLTCLSAISINSMAADQTVSIGYAQTKATDVKTLKGVNLQYKYETESLPVGIVVSSSYMTSKETDRYSESWEDGGADYVFDYKDQGKVKYFSLLAGPSYEFNEYVSVYGLLGFSKVKYDVNESSVLFENGAQVGSYNENDKKSKTAFAYGLGVAINPVENISVNIGYEGTRSKYYDQKMNFNGFNIGVGYKF